MQFLVETVEEFIKECLVESKLEKSEILEAFLGISPESITIRTPQDIHGRIHEGEILEESRYRLKNRVI